MYPCWESSLLSSIPTKPVPPVISTVLISSFRFVAAMIRKVYMHTLCLLLLFASGALFAQKKYDTKTESSSKSLEGKSLSGFTTVFGYDRADVRKAWWKYARAFGTPLDMRSYYKVTIPSESTDGNVDLELFTQSSGEGKVATFFLGVENSKYKEQAKLLLLDFKKMFYIQQVVNEIEGKQAEADELGKAYKKNAAKKERQKVLRKTKELEKQIEELKRQIKEIERG